MEIDLFEEVYRLVRQIPKGKISTYGAIAKALGNKKASRAVGFILNQNPDPDFTPCYKVVNSDGTLGGFSAGIEEKIKRLMKDGIRVINGRISNFEDVFFDDFNTDYPLKKIRMEQIELSKKVIIKDDFDQLYTVCGLDVSYSIKGRIACAGYVIMDFEGNTIEKNTITGEFNFPYIPTYLAYTEIPLYRKLLKIMKEKPSIFMLDGNGILHPYNIGVASHFGVYFDVPSIGVAKSLLYGEIKENYVFDKNRKLGYVLRRKGRPIFVSPGHRISIKTSVDIVKKFQIYRLPEPIRQAHILVKSKIKEINQKI